MTLGSAFENPDYIGFSGLLRQGRSSSQPVASAQGVEKTWEDFVRAVAGWRAAFSKQAERRFALFHPDTWHFATALFGGWLAGKVLILPGDTLPGTLQALSAEVDGFAGEFPEGLTKPRLPKAVASGELGAPPILDLRAAALGVMTSGSTGTPALFVKELGQLEREVTALETRFGARIGTARVLATVSHQHIYGLLFRVLWPLSAGRVFESSQLFFGEEIQAHAERAGSSVLVTSPTHLKRLLLGWGSKTALPAAEEASSRSPIHDRIRAVFSSGGPLEFETARLCGDRLASFPLEIFGSSETGGIAFRERREDHAPWQPFPGVEVDVDPERGLLRLRSPHLPNESWFTTSDRARLLPEGGFELLGRSDRIVKIAEKRISLGSIEQSLAASGWVSEARVLVLSGARAELGTVIIPNAAGRELLAREGKLALNRALRTAAAAQVEAVGLPRRFRYVERFPENSQGKVPEAALEALFRDRE